MGAALNPTEEGEVIHAAMGGQEPEVWSDEDAKTANEEVRPGEHPGDVREDQRHK